MQERPLKADALLQLLQNELGGEGLHALPTLSLTLPTVKKPIMAPSVETAVLDAMAQFRHRETWKKWGMNELREQAGAILLYGPPGTGKTVIAKWMGRQIKKGFKELSVASLGTGGGGPGDAERGVHTFFDDGEERKNMTIFLDEVDHLLMPRDNGKLEASWQIGTAEAIMIRMATYKGLIIAATNLPKMLDSASNSRFMAIIKVDRPTFEMRLLLWKQKWPALLPLQPTVAELKELAKFDLSGREIENALVMAISRAARKQMVKPKMEMVFRSCEAEHRKKIEE